MIIDEKIRLSRKALQNPYAYLSDDGGYAALDVTVVPASIEQITTHRKTSEDPYALLDDMGGYSASVATTGIVGTKYKDENKPDLILKSLKPNDTKFISNETIEKTAIRLQRMIWEQYSNDSEYEKNPIKLLKPSLSFKLLGYEYDENETIGQYNQGAETFEVAGLIDSQSKHVKISNQFTKPQQRFTSAHELGHAVLHQSQALGLHRDRPFDGSRISPQRNSIEYQADRFAVYFLMPEKLLRQKFKELFLTDCFQVTEDNLFALGSRVADEVENNCHSIRDLSRILSTTDQFNGQNFYSLAQQFEVSVEAMAIRLEELDLCEFHQKK